MRVIKLASDASNAHNLEGNQSLAPFSRRTDEEESTLIDWLRASMFLVPALSICAGVPYSVSAELADVEFKITDEAGQPLPSMAIVRRIESGERGVPINSVDGLNWKGYVQHAGSVHYRLQPGDYSYVLDRSSEYEQRAGCFTVKVGERRELDVELGRLVTLRDRGWYSADLHIHRAPAEAAALAVAADLDIAPVITWWNQSNQFPINSKQTWRQHGAARWLSFTAGEDERQGGALLFFRMNSPIDITKATPEYPSPVAFAKSARENTPNVWLDIEKPFWWDMPTWIAHGVGDSIGICNNHQLRDGMLANEAWGKPRDLSRWPNPTGNGMWTQEIYYHLLNCGIRIPPSAGSASGVLNNPVGYNRVYVHLSEPLTPDAWWNGLAAGHCFVTNGPLIDCRINERLPGSVLRSTGDDLMLNVELELTSREIIKQLELIVNGRVVKRIPLDRNATRQSIQFQYRCPAPGWCLMRAVTDNESTFRFASTGPFYLESPTSSRLIDGNSVKFFATWVRERISRLQASDLKNDELDSVLRYHVDALEFWTPKSLEERDAAQ